MLGSLSAFRTFRITVAVVAAAVLAGGCTSPDDPRVSANALLVGALPPAEAERGVYVVDLRDAGDLSPGSRLGPLVAGVIDDAVVMVETAAPPITILGGVPEDVAVPEGGVREGTTLVFAQPSTSAEVIQRLREHAKPTRKLQDMADATEPVRWRGPTPAPGAAGYTTVTLDRDEITFVTDGDDSSAMQAGLLDDLANGGPPNSPGKPWRTMLRNPEMHPHGGAVRLVAERVDMPGILLRSLIDQKQFTFLAAAG